MEVIITALGPDNRGLADPIIHDVTDRGGRIAEIQMYDHDEEQIFAMLCRVDLESVQVRPFREAMIDVASRTGLAVRVWTPPGLRDEGDARKPRIAVACTYVPETPRAVLSAVRQGRIDAEAVVMLSNRKKLASVADEFDVPFEMIGDSSGAADDQAIVRIMDQYNVDYLILARYMRILPAATCWQFAGGRIINLHHGLLPGFPGFRPYHDAYAARMLTFGATCHFIIPELDAGNQTINQRTFSVAPGTSLETVIQQGERDNEPECLVEGVRRVCSGEVQLHFHRVIASGSD